MLVKQEYQLILLLVKHQIMMLICLVYDWIALIFIKIVSIIYDTYFISMFQCPTVYLCIFTIITYAALRTTYTTNKINMIVIKLIEFNVIGVSSAFYNLITTLEYVSQIFRAEKFSSILFIVLIERTMIVHHVADEIIVILDKFELISKVGSTIEVNSPVIDDFNSNCFGLW